MKLHTRLLPIFCFLLCKTATASDVTALPLFGGDVRSLAQDPVRPERVLLGTADGQLFVSEDFGNSWAKLKPGLKRRNLVIDNLVFDPVEPTVVYAAAWELKDSRGALFRSRDSGISWEEIPLGRFNSTVRAIAIAPSDNNLIALGIAEGVIVSKDRGETWQRINRGYRSLHNAHSLAFDPRDSQTLYVGTWRLAWKTTDLGATWEPIHKGMFWDSDLFTILVDPRDTATVYASTCSGIYKSTNGGLQWRKLRHGLPVEAKRTRTLRFDASNPDRLYAGTTAGLYRSEDAGASWERILDPVTVNAVLVHPEDTQRILIGTDDAGLFLSRDGGASFELSNRGFHQRQVTALVRGQGNRLYATVAGDGPYGGFLVSRDNGLNWEGANEGLPDITTTILNILVGQSTPDVYLATAKGLLKGQPANRPWQLLASTAKLTVNAMAFADPREQSLILACNEGLFRLDVARDRLRRLKIPVYDRAFLAALRDADRDLLYVGTEMGVFRSSDGGQSWTIRVDGLPYLSVGRLFQVGRRLFAVSQSTVYYSESDGDRWAQSQGLLPVEIVSITGHSESGQLFASDTTIGYLFSSVDSGATWTASYVQPETSAISSMVVLDDGELLAATLQEGILRLRHLESRPARVDSNK